MYSPYQKGAVRVGDGRVLLLTSGTRTRPQRKEGEIPSGDAKNRKDDLHDGGGAAASVEGEGRFGGRREEGAVVRALLSLFCGRQRLF